MSSAQRNVITRIRRIRCIRCIRSKPGTRPKNVAFGAITCARHAEPGFRPDASADGRVESNTRRRHL